MIRILTDSASDILPAEAAQLGVDVIPLNVTLEDGTVIRDGVDLTPSEYYEHMAGCKKLPTTSQPSPELFEKFYAEAAAAGDEVVGIFLSHELSGTYQCAKLAADLANVDNVLFVDSTNVCLGEGLLVRMAAHLRDEGKSAVQIAATLEHAKEHLHLVAAIDDLKYLRKGGRLPAAVAVAGGMLGIKPLITIKEGKVAMAGKARGLPGAYVALFKKIEELGAAGVLMCLGNGYAVYDVGFELSFAAVMGTLAGAECAGRGRERYYDRKKKRKSRWEKPPRAVLLFRRFAGGVWDSLCVSLCASAATFPVLVLRGMSTTVWAVASGVAVLWLVGPMLSFGLGAALLGLVAQNFESLPLFEIIRRPAAFCAEGLAWLMNEWAFRVSVLPGASLWFDGTYAALVCLVLILLCAMAMRRHIRLRVALPTVILLVALAIGLETALSWNVVNIELVGTRASPAVVITQREKAVVLFRGGSTTRRAVESQLEKRGVKTV